MPTIVASTFTLSLGEDAVLMPRTPTLTEAYHELLVANQERLAHWERWAAEPMTLDGARAFLDAGARGWIEGTELPVAIAVAAAGGWQLVGSAGLRVNRYTGSAEAGYWIDGGHEGRGLVSRAMTALLDQAFGPLGLHRWNFAPMSPTSKAGLSRPGWGSAKKASNAKRWRLAGHGGTTSSTASSPPNGTTAEWQPADKPRRRPNIDSPSRSTIGGSWRSAQQEFADLFDQLSAHLPDARCRNLGHRDRRRP